MGLQAAGHECDRFLAVGLPCPFRRFVEDDDQEPDEEDEGDELQIPFMMPARRAKEKELARVTTLAVAPKELREALERMAAFKNLGGLPSLPDFPLQGRGHPAIISALAAIALTVVFRTLRRAGLGQGSQLVRVGERRVAQGLSKVARPPRSQGRGGIHHNAAADMRRLLGFGPRRRRRDSTSTAVEGFDSFSETGFP